jgi:hypothetical protein
MRKMRGKGAPKKRKAEGMSLQLFHLFQLFQLTFYDRFEAIEQAETRTEQIIDGWHAFIGVNGRYLTSRLCNNNYNLERL